MEILINFFGILRTIGMALDSIVFGLVDNAYNLINDLARNPLFSTDTIETVMKNLYVVMGLFAFFRVAIILVNAMINPDKLTEKGNGIANVGINILIMFAMLIAVPKVFEKAYDIQALIVKNHVVDRLFLNTETLEKTNPGRAMQSIAIGALVTWNENITSCSGKCQDAKTAYENMAAGKTMTGEDDPENGGFKMTSLAKYASVQETVNGEKEFVYVYKAMLTFAVGIFLTYILFSFAIDIGIRTVELAVLQIIAPLFIATYIDPKSAKSGPFKNWVTTTLKTYASLFIKLAIISLTLLLISLIPRINFSEWYEKGIGKLTILISILIFAKKAPDWIEKLIGMSSGGLGDGLGISKKLSSAALIGGYVNNVKYGGLAGAVGGGLTVGKAIKDIYRGRKNAVKEAGKNGEKIKTASDKRRVYREKKLGVGRSLGRVFLAGTGGFVKGAAAGSHTSNAKDAVISANNAAVDFSGKAAMDTRLGIVGRVINMVKGLPDEVANLYGGGKDEVIKKKKELENQKTAESWTRAGDYKTQGAGIGKGKVIVGKGDANKVMNAMNKSGIKVNYDNFEAIQYGLNQGKITLDNGEIKGLAEIEHSADGSIKSVKFTDKTEISGESLKKGCGGIFDMNSTALQNQEKLVNSYQTTCVNNYSQNIATMQGALSTFNDAKKNVSVSSLETLKLNDRIMHALGNEISISIGDSISKNLTDIRNAINNANDNIKNQMLNADEDRKKELAYQMASLDALKSEAETQAEKERTTGTTERIIPKREEEFYHTMQQSMQLISQVNKAQKDLETVVESVHGETINDKINQLAISAKDIDDAISAMEDKEEKK